MKASEVRNLTEQELQLKERNLREQLRKTRFSKYTGELTNTAKIKRIKRTLARILTEMNVRGSASVDEPQAEV